MADRDAKNSTAPKAEEAPPRKPIASEDVRALIDRLVPNIQDADDSSVLRPRYDFLAPEWRGLCERLRDDHYGAVSAALNVTGAKVWARRCRTL